MIGREQLRIIKTIAETITNEKTTVIFYTFNYRVGETSAYRIIEILDRIGVEYTYSKASNKITLENNSAIYFRSLKEKEKLRGLRGIEI